MKPKKIQKIKMRHSSNGLFLNFRFNKIYSVDLSLSIGIIFNSYKIRGKRKVCQQNERIFIYIMASIHYPNASKKNCDATRKEKEKEVGVPNNCKRPCLSH